MLYPSNYRVVFLKPTETKLLNHLCEAPKPGSWRLFQTVQWLLQHANFMCTLPLSNKTCWLLHVNLLIENNIEKGILDVQLMK